jgi:hypothetical protein
MRVLGFLFVLSTALAADVVILKDGGKVSGKVVDKNNHYEVTTENGVRGFLKEEVERIVTSPKEFLGDADKTVEEVKAAYQAALAISDPAEQQGKVKEAIARLRTAREAYATTRELFPEDKYAELDQKLMQVMQLMRLCRDRLHSERENSDRPSFAATPAPASGMQLAEAFSILLDPAKRSDAARRAAACESFRLQRASAPEVYELATAAMLFLSKSEAEWNLKGAALKTLQDYFAKPWLKDPMKMTPITHQEAAQWLADQVSSLKKADAAAPTEPITIFGIGHVGHAPAGGESDKVARLLGLIVQNGIAGTPEGHVIRDLNSWIAAGDFDLAVLAWIREYRAIDTPITRFDWAYAMLRSVVAKKRGFERPISAFNTVQTSNAAVRDHLTALVASIRAAGICGVCAGEGRIRCSNCCGKKDIVFQCPDCKGTGRMINKVGIQLDNCPRCKSTGNEKKYRCEKCKDGYNECRQCDKKKHEAPALEDICTMIPCEQCDGRGFVFRRILWACKSCMGTGQKLIPKTDPGKMLH